MTETARHRWIRGALRTDREELVSGLDLPPALLSPVDAHRRLRGPYTAAGAVLRAIVPAALASMPELVFAHDIEVLSVAPELREVVPASRETLTSLAVPGERTRFYSRLRTLRIAHGLTELLRDYLPGGSPRSLIVENVEYADPTDVELLSVVLRRIDPGRLTLLICTGTVELPDGPLATALTDHTEPLDAAPSTVDNHAVDNHAVDGDPASLAAAYIAADCTSDDPRLLAGYQALDLSARAVLHDQRAVELEARAEKSLHLGAIPFHREHGTDPAGAGADALRVALDYCIEMGFYHATVDVGVRGRTVIDWDTQVEHWWAFTTKMTTSLAALSHAAEAEALYDEARALRTSPDIHMQAAYATAMLYTRHHEPQMKDDRKAKGWINEAIAIASIIPDARQRAFQTVFNRNGLALIEVHRGNLPEALRLVDEGLNHLDQELDPTEHRLHRSVLQYNRGQVYAGLGRLEDALADYTAVIADDPNYSEYYFDRGNLARRLGRDEEALADYETAMRLSPPFPEVFYNRADIRLSQGDINGALADFSYVLELDPDYLDAYVNRAGLLADLGEQPGARRDVQTGLALDPTNPHLHCILGQLTAATGDTAAAAEAFDAALAADPTLQAAWAGRAALAFEQGDVTRAITDLDRALDLGDDPALRFNRATALAAADRWDAALADLDRAVELDPTDPDALAERDRYRLHLTKATTR